MIEEGQVFLVVLMLVRVCVKREWASEYGYKSSHRRGFKYSQH